MVEGIREKFNKDIEIGIIHTATSPCRCAEAIEVGIKALGFRSSIYNSEDILIKGNYIVDISDLIIDHTDTFLERGGMRAFVRLILEAKGAKLIGAGSHAAMIGDDKYATKKKFQELNIPTPEGIVIFNSNWDLPNWLMPPYIIKPIYEHMSRGITVVDDKKEARAITEHLIRTLKQPVIIERFISGREMAVSMIEDTEKGLVMLPPLEWIMDPHEKYQNRSFKLTEHSRGRKDVMPAVLSKKDMERLSYLAKTAFRGLGMRDYCRFDIKFSMDGEFFFLETNISPSMEKAEAMALSAQLVGINYTELIGKIILSAAKRYGMII